MINYKQLFYFWNVAKYGGVTRAANQLFLTPQTISGQISELEQTLDVKLFHREGRRLSLTEAGKIAFDQAEEIFYLGGELEAFLKGRQESSQLLFRVGIADVVPKSIAYRFIVPAIQHIESIRISCYESKLEQLFAELAIHKIDLVIADRPLQSQYGVKGFNHFLGESIVAFYGTPELKRRYQPNFPNSIADAPLLLPGGDSATRHEIDKWLAKLGVPVNIKGEFSDSALMKAFAKEGFGIFPAPLAISDEMQRQYGLKLIGNIEEITLRYYAISAERKLRHPAVVAISKAAQTSLV